MQRFTFAVDQGNSTTKAAIFDGSALIAFEKAAKGQESDLEQWIIKHQCMGGIVSSVRSSEAVFLGQHSGKSILWMSPNLPMPFTVNYTTPQTLGVDRLANAAAALAQSYGPQAVIIDCGSCLTITTLFDGQLQGGSISPGLGMRFKALQTFTARLPLIENIPLEVPLIGHSTESSIQSGVILGMLAEIEEIINAYCRKISPLSVIITGGDAGHFVPRLKSPIFAEPFLTLMGLHEIYQYQNLHLK